MNRVKYFTLLTTLSVLGVSAIAISGVEAAGDTGDRYLIAQQSADKNQNVETGDEMMDALQKRQEKLENFQELEQIQNLLDSQMKS